VSDTVYSIGQGSSARAVADMLRVLFPDASTVLDMTHGNAAFWRGTDAGVTVTGMDINPQRAKHVAADFTALPFVDDAFDVCIFDPPYLANVSKSNPGLMGRRFGSYNGVDDVKAAVQAGCREAWRVSSIGVIVKVQNHTHGQRSVRMTRWVEDVFPHDAYGEIHLQRPHKLLDPKWSEQLSIYSNGATFLAYRHGDQRHGRRRPAGRAAS
jgi:hypothetical protein